MSVIARKAQEVQRRLHNRKQVQNADQRVDTTAVNITNAKHMAPVHAYVAKNGCNEITRAAIQAKLRGERQRTVGGKTAKFTKAQPV